MANVSLKKDFRDGDKLFAQQLNNNFGAIEAGMSSFNQVNWEEEATKISFFKGTTEQVEERPITNGQLLYNTNTGETALDDKGERIVTGSGNVVAIGGEEPTNPATKLWVPKDTLETLGTEVVNSLEGNQIDKSPSVNAVSNAIKHNFVVGQEIATNDYLNGKRIYKQLYTGKLVNATTAVDLFPYGVTAENIWLDESNSFLAKPSPEGNGYSEWLPLNYYYAANDYSRLWIRTNANVVRYKSGADMSANGYVYTIVLAYTKPDEGSAVNEI